MDAQTNAPKESDVRTDANEVHIGASRLLKQFEERHSLTIVRAPAGFDKRSIGRLWVRCAASDGLKAVWVTGQPLRQLETSVLAEPERFLKLVDDATRLELVSVLSGGASAGTRAVNPMNPQAELGKYSSSVSAMSAGHSPLAAAEERPHLVPMGFDSHVVESESPWLEDTRLDQLLGEVEVLNSPTGRAHLRDDSEIVLELMEYMRRVKTYVESIISDRADRISTSNATSGDTGDTGDTGVGGGARVPRPDESLPDALADAVLELGRTVTDNSVKLALVLEGVMDANPRSQIFSKFVWSLFECIPHVRVLVMNSEFTNFESLLPSLVRSCVLTPEELRVNTQEIVLDARRRGMELSEQEAEEVRRLSMGWPVHARILLTHAFRDISGALLLDRGVPSSIHFFQDSLFTNPADFEKVFIFIMSPFEAFTVSDAVAMFTQIQPLFPVVIENVLGRPLFLVEEEKCAELMSETEIRSLFLSVASFGFIVPRSISAAAVEYTHCQLARHAVDAFTSYMELPLRERLAGFAVERLLSEGRLVEALAIVAKGHAWEAVIAIIKQSWAQILELPTRLLREVFTDVPESVILHCPRLAVLSGLLFDESPSASGSADGFLGEILGISDDTSGSNDRDILFEMEDAAYQELPLVLAQWGFSRFLLSEVTESQGAFDLGLEVARTVDFRREDALLRLSVYKAAHLVLMGFCNKADEYLDSLREATRSSEHALAEIAESVLAWMATSRMEACDCNGQTPVSLIPSRGNNPIVGIRMAAHNFCAIESGREVEALLRIDRQISKLRGATSYTLVRQLLQDSRVNLLMALGRFNQAEESINEADGAELLNIEARTRLLYLRGEHAEAIALSVSGLEFASDSPRIRQALLTVRAGAELALGNRVGARENTRQALAIAKEHGIVNYFAMLPHDEYVKLGELVPELSVIVGNKFDGRRFPFAFSEGAAGLTARERQVVRAMGREQSVEMVALGLGISRATVESYLAELMDKLDAEDFTELEEKAREFGFLD